MTAKERVISSRLIHKMDMKRDYAERIGLSCTLKTASADLSLYSERKTGQYCR